MNASPPEFNPAGLFLLRCPLNRVPLRRLEPAERTALNERIRAGQVHTRRGRRVSEPLEDGLIGADGQWIYRVAGGIPQMLVDEALDAGQGQGTLPPPRSTG